MIWVLSLLLAASPAVASLSPSLPTGCIEGAVRLKDGSGIPGVRIEMQFTARGNEQSRTFTVSRGDGSFAFEHLPPGRAWIMMKAPPADPYRSGQGQAKDVEVGEGQTSTVEFAVRRILVSGRVTRSGEPAAGLRVTIQPLHGSYPFPPSSAPAPQWKTAVTRDDGSYALLLDTPGEAYVWITTLDGRTGFPQPRIIIPDADAHSFDVNLSGALVSGIVVDQDTGLPLAGATVRADSRPHYTAPASARQTARVSTGDDGRFQFQLEAGKYEVRAGRFRQQGVPGLGGYYRGAQTSLTVGNADQPEIRFALSKGQSISGRVIDPSGLGISGLSVMARGPQSSGGYGVTQPDGSFEIFGLGSRPHTLTAFSDAGLFASRSDVTPGTRDVELALRPGGRVRLSVTGPGGSSLEGARAALVSVDGRPFPAWRGANTTDAAGIIELPAPTGSVEIDVRSGKLQGLTKAAVAAGGVAEVSVRLADVRPAETP